MHYLFSKIFGTKRGNVGPVEPDPPEAPMTLRERIQLAAGFLHTVVFGLLDEEAKVEKELKLLDILRLDFEMHGFDVEDVFIVKREIHGINGFIFSDRDRDLQVEVGGSRLAVAYIRLHDPDDDETDRDVDVFWNEDWITSAVDLSFPETTYLR